MKCNLDAKGKAVRLIWGLVMLALAAIVATLLLLEIIAGWGWWAAVLAGAAGGGFGLFEARHGWCALRAMGIRTPI